MSKKKTKEEYICELKIKNPNIELVGDYIYANEKSSHRCLKHDFCWDVKPSSVLRGAGCPMCHSERISDSKTRTNDEYIKLVSEKFPNVEVLGEYVSATDKILHKCKIDGTEWMVTPDAILHGHGCKTCAKRRIGQKNSKPFEEYLSDLSKKNPNIICIGDYVNSTTNTLHKCLIDGYEWYAQPSSILANKGCPKCAGNIHRTHEEYVALVEEINPNIEVVGEYFNARDKIEHRCLIHNTVWSTRPYLILAGSGCPSCNESHGEKIIASWLRKNNIAFEQQKTFEGCKDKKCLPFDFYIPSLNIAIEFDGEQHFKPINFFGGKSRFERLVAHDKAKDEFCAKQGINLLRISYNENIEKELVRHIFTN